MRLTLAKKIIDRYRFARTKAFLPLDPRYDDIFVVEFPKSGITWLSSILSNVFLGESDKPYHITYCNIGFFVPDIHVSRHIKNPFWDYPRNRFIKSHSSFNPHYKFVIYLLRNPISVMRSYYDFCQYQMGYKDSFDRFIRHKEWGIKAWARHVDGWLHGKDTSQRLHLIKYEDLLENPVDNIKKLLDNFGIDVNKNSIKTAISKSGIDQMRVTEELYRQNNPRYKYKFMRKGKKSALDETRDEDKDYILEISHKIVSNYYPGLSNANLDG